MKASTIYRNILNRYKKPAIVLVWLFLWQLASDRLGHELLLVSPLRTVETLLELCMEREFWYSIGNSLFHCMSAFLLALAVGGLLAFLGWRMPLLHEFLMPPLSAMKATPVASFIILVLLCASSQAVSMVCAFVMVMPIVYANIYQGFCNIDQKLLEVGQAFALERGQYLKLIYVPSLKPYLLSACTVGIGFCWKSGVAAEVIGLPNHTIGMHLYNAKVYLETPELFAWTLTVVLLSVGIEKLLLRVLRRVLR